MPDVIDVGGSTARSILIDARTIFEEGVRMPPVKLYAGGKLNEEVLRFFCHNSRTPRETRADIMTITAGTATGAQRIKDIYDRFGKETYLEACDALLDRTRMSVIELLRRNIPEGERFEFEDYTDDDGLDGDRRTSPGACEGSAHRRCFLRTGYAIARLAPCYLICRRRTPHPP